MNKYVEKVFGDQNKRKLKKLQSDVDAINALEPEIQKLSDPELQEKTAEFRARLKEGATLEDVKHEAFAVVREAAMRTLGQRHYDVQLLGGLVLHNGDIAEMKTGEGKTLSATCAVYLNALEGNGVHVVTVNDYLAKRDADWMGQVYYFLGLTVGCIGNQSAAWVYDADIEEVRRKEAEEKEDTDTSSTEGDGYEALVVADMDHLREVPRGEAYKVDIIFGTNNEFGFDYLRDNMVRRKEERVQRGLHFAVIDEVDSILIDEARTPLIISAPAEEANEQYYQFSAMVSALKENNDFVVDEKMRSVALNDVGIAKLEQSLGVENIYVEGGLRTVNHIEQALKARMLFTKDKDYVVKGDEVIIVDEFTGRMMEGRRFSEGLHQAIEAKEGLPIKQESRTLATITLQNLFRLYKKIGGMTGTAETEAEEFFKIYGLDVVVVPTHRDIVRADNADKVFKNAKGKYQAVVKAVKELNENGQPVLIGTASIEQNELLSEFLTANGVRHNILNAKKHQSEAEIIAQAGKLGSVTVATNMAGRGVDIILGGNPVNIEDQRKVIELGGLAVLGTERHESRRIDNQLRGRSGRQGDPGSSQFYVSMDDELMRIFGSDRMQNMMNKLGVADDMPIENRIVSRSIESAQTKVEGRNFDIRKHLVEYDDVMNKHRDVVYRQRNSVLDMEPDALRVYIHELVDSEIEGVVSFHTNLVEAEDENGQVKKWDMEEICAVMSSIYPLDTSMCITKLNSIRLGEATKLGDAEARTEIINYLSDKAVDAYDKMVDQVGNPEVVTQVERGFALRAVDMLWVEHLDQMAFLRDSIGLRGYAQRDPLVEYKRESYQLFQELLANMQKQVVHNIYKIGDAKVVADSSLEGNRQQGQQLHAPAKEMGGEDHSGHDHVGHEGHDHGEEKKKGEAVKPYVAVSKAVDGHKVGRNEPCPCGSGKKYKKCHGV